MVVDLKTGLRFYERQDGKTDFWARANEAVAGHEKIMKIKHLDNNKTDIKFDIQS